jgi:hypothetical protein
MRKSRQSVAGLIALNAVLLGGLAFVTFSSNSLAQARSRSSYSMVAGTIKGQEPPVLYIVDETAQELVGLTWDDNKKQLVGMGFRNLAADVADIGRTRN